MIEFLSYEGTFVAVGGPADGMSSNDIGVSESSSSPVGDSLQLTGSGTMGGDFTWAPSQPNTFGGVNTGQTFGVVTGPTDPVINEFVANHAGADSEAFVEVLGDASTDSSAFTVREIEVLQVVREGSALHRIDDDAVDANPDLLTCAFNEFCGLANRQLFRQ